MLLISCKIGNSDSIDFLPISKERLSTNNIIMNLKSIIPMNTFNRDIVINVTYLNDVTTSSTIQK